MHQIQKTLSEFIINIYIQMGSRLACILFQGGTERPPTIIEGKQIGLHSFLKRKGQLQTSLLATCAYILTFFLLNKKIHWITSTLVIKQG